MNRRPRVLVVEDDASIQLLLGVVLGESYDVVGASSRAEAIAAMSDEHIDVVLTDFNLPDSSGTELIAALRSAAATDLPILMVSGSEGAAEATARSAGAQAYLPKPFDQDELLETVARLLRDRRSRAEAPDPRPDIASGEPRRP